MLCALHLGLCYLRAHVCASMVCASVKAAQYVCVGRIRASNILFSSLLNTTEVLASSELARYFARFCWPYFDPASTVQVEL